MNRSAALCSVVTVLLVSCASPLPREAPVVERVVKARDAAPREVAATDLLDWGRQQAPSAWVSTSRDMLPNGLAVSMMPIFVDWNSSSLNDRDPFVLVRNVNVDGNPVTGDNLLATVRVPLSGIDEVQWCMVVTRDKNNKDTSSGHGQLRFLFDVEQRPVVLSEDGRRRPEYPHLDDLIVSWEAWRPPLVRFDLFRGFDPESFALTLRVYSGAQRFLTDALRNSPWRCYPIVLPDTNGAAREVLMTGLLMGDALARRVLHEMVEDGTIVVPELDELADFDEADIEQARAVLSRAAQADDAVAGLMGQADISYHTLERSCITQALMTVQIALNRIYESNELGAAPQMQSVPESYPEWFNDLPESGMGNVLVRGPQALWFIARNGNVIPTNAHRILDDAGLLLQDPGGKPVVHYYHVESMTPYGHIKDNMM